MVGFFNQRAMKTKTLVNYKSLRIYAILASLHAKMDVGLVEILAVFTGTITIRGGHAVYKASACPRLARRGRAGRHEIDKTADMMVRPWPVSARLTNPAATGLRAMYRAPPANAARPSPLIAPV